MGLFDIIGKVSDPADVFGVRSGAAAAETAKDLGYKSAAMQQEWMDYIKSQSEPFQESALRALPVQEAMIGLGEPGAQQAEVQKLMESPFYQSMLGQGEEAVGRNLSMTGGLRSGTANEALAQNSQNVLQSLYQNKLQNLGTLSGRGLQSQQLGQQGGAQALGDLTSTFGQIGNVGIGQAANQQNTAMGLAGMAASLFSDERLKTNINKIGEKNGLPFYEWEWNETAKEKFGLEGKEQGHMATDVELKYPDAVNIKDGYRFVDYGLVKEMSERGAA